MSDRREHLGESHNEVSISSPTALLETSLDILTLALIAATALLLAGLF